MKNLNRRNFLRTGTTLGALAFSTWSMGLARIWGSRNTWRLQQTMQLEKRHGKWIILKSIATTF